MPGEGFYVTMAFLAVFLGVAGMAAYTNNQILTDLAKNFGSIIASIAAFWFATRGQTGGGD
jgi:hypothetical protein